MLRVLIVAICISFGIVASEEANAQSRGFRTHSSAQGFTGRSYPGYGYGYRYVDPYRFDGFGYDPYRYGSFRMPDMHNDIYFDEQLRSQSRFPGRNSRRRPALELKPQYRSYPQ